MRAGACQPGGSHPLGPHTLDRRDFDPRKIAVKGGRRPSRSDGAEGVALEGDLARLHANAPGGWRGLVEPAAGGRRGG